MRVDAGLSRLIGLSRTVIVGLTESGHVALDGRTAGKSTGWRPARSGGASSRAGSDRQSAAGRVGRGATVLHADDDILVVDKPVGVAAHPAPAGPGPPCSAGWPRSAIGCPPPGRPSGRASCTGWTSAHRRDGRRHLELAYTELKRAFKERTVDKRYHAVAQGHPDRPQRTIDAPIDRQPKHDYRFAVVAGGRPSITHYDTIEAFRAASLLDIRLETGRTHQIRVHLSALRHPCVGDLAYGADPTLARRLSLERQWLHARSLGFAHPADGRRAEFTSPYPADLEHALQLLRD